MKLTVDGDRFDRLQANLVGGLVQTIRESLESAKLPPNTTRALLENVAFSVATVLDGSQSVEVSGKELVPVLAFEDSEGELVYPGGQSWMHEYVFGTISQ